MFYRLIQKKCDEWMKSPDCTIRELIQYIYRKNKMRDAQIEAIKIYLFLKIACGNRPLWKLFIEGRFNSLDFNSMELTVEARKVLTTNKAAAALMEYSLLTDKDGNQLAPEMEKVIRQQSENIDYEETFKQIFYGVNYTDYLFSLPMGAGKTYLMAAFIYLDLYFAINEPENPAFAHNFLVLAPSGLKSSIIPSLKSIQEFDPTWIIPEPTASNLKRMIKFEILDEQKSAKKSNLVRNPNAQKINNHQPLDDLMGLVAITNAEKVILDRIGKDEDPALFDKEELTKIRIANELREIIGRIPHLSVFIDEVHHAADGEIKLRQVVEEWTVQHSFCGVLGFSGTPYLEKAEKVTLADSFVIKNTDLSNVVYYYPLIQGVGNFLKVPEVKFADNDTETIVRNGVKEFLDRYIDTVYENGTCAKLAIYCGQIETLEETVFPLVSSIVSEYGLNPTEAILKYHGGNKSYPQPEDSETEFASLDTDFSCIRIVLLVQIGKEGWDCKSLTGVILPQKGVCPMNMVLQTSCRCLRQVVKNADETALIWLNKFNADTLNKQLKQQQNISLQELNRGKHKKQIMIERFPRTTLLKVPPIDFYQLKVSYQTLTTEEHPHTDEKLTDEKILTEADVALIHRQDLSGNILGHYMAETEEGEYISFRRWLYLITKESFRTLPPENLKRHEEALRKIFERITIKDESGNTRYDNSYDQSNIRSLIRKAFVPKRDFTVREEIVPCDASLLQIERLVSPISVENDKPFYPSQEDVKTIIDWDENAQDKVLSPEELALIEKMKQMGYRMPEPADPHPERKQTYHYLPYRFDSGLEREFFKDSILPYLKDKPLEIYFNGDDSLTEFKIDCYKQVGKEWTYIGKYVPDFLLLSRKDDGTIHRIIIIETKGEGFAAKFADRKKFMETEFIQKNNERFGYERFHFLYLEDTQSKEEREKLTIKTIKEFFKI
ncbi:DEAD/DEAH box helicase family protein [Bacteroides caecigallinarum]|uniref:DEAD/DEAH box helicase family protein n=1 Tax=Bacteroides caecigallinarum TaxID=1411144 RepID=UPI001F216C94|nr:DEAD/DEAH box helicase family protein [Bacteroides caecigallinarum]MCF2551590.1 DEAD/DEAH box helicase family protein [Bacteroides caecigallinarum]